MTDQQEWRSVVLDVNGSSFGVSPVKNNDDSAESILRTGENKRQKEADSSLELSIEKQQEKDDKSILRIPIQTKVSDPDESESSTLPGILLAARKKSTLSNSSHMYRKNKIETNKIKRMEGNELVMFSTEIPKDM